MRNAGMLLHDDECKNCANLGIKTKQTYRSDGTEVVRKCGVYKSFVREDADACSNFKPKKLK